MSWNLPSFVSGKIGGVQGLIEACVPLLSAGGGKAARIDGINGLQRRAVIAANV